MSSTTQDELQTLVKMANQIAANFSFYEDAVERTRNHLQRFWAPSMRQQIISHAAAGGSGLEDFALQAVQQLTA